MTDYISTIKSEHDAWIERLKADFLHKEATWRSLDGQ